MKFGEFVNKNVTPAYKKKAKVEMTEEFKNVIQSVENSTSVNPKFIFVTGSAGTGKSTLIKKIISIPKKRVIVTAPTGIASWNIGGTTLHSFFRLPLEPLPSPRKLFGDVVTVLKKMDVLIIDEVSMVKPDILDAVSQSLQMHRENKLSFGGVTVVIFGDLFQLPPVVTSDQVEIYSKYYETNFFFSAHCLKRIEPEIYNLTKVFRQKDSNFLEILGKIRIGQDLDNIVKTVNKLCYENKKKIQTELTLTSRTARAEEINDKKLNLIEAEEKIFIADYQGNYFKGKVDKQLPAPYELKLKKGCQIIFTKNNDPLWINGTIGKVIDYDEDSLQIEIQGRSLQVEREKWSSFKYVIKKNDDGKEKINKEETASYSQFPVRLGWAVTIHKSQGLTLNSCTIDLGHGGGFVHGQVYVALSRCKTLEKIQLTEPLQRSDIILDKTILRFYKEFLKFL